ncbi:MAG: hypothetical protein JWQ38_264 [Flavipsychrobacter sp.]|nr:hypothetical protein [Flavipsychrobacter sp.]
MMLFFSYCDTLTTMNQVVGHSHNIGYTWHGS